MVEKLTLPSELWRSMAFGGEGMSADCRVLSGLLIKRFMTRESKRCLSEGCLPRGNGLEWLLGPSKSGWAMEFESDRCGRRFGTLRGGGLDGVKALVRLETIES